MNGKRKKGRECGHFVLEIYCTKCVEYAKVVCTTVHRSPRANARKSLTQYQAVFYIFLIHAVCFLQSWFYIYTQVCIISRLYFNKFWAEVT